MDLAALRIEVEKPAYNGMDDFQTADAINAGTYQVTQDIPTDLAKMALIETNALDWGELIGVAEGSITPSTQAAAKRKRCITIRELLDTQSPLEVATNEALWTRVTNILTDLVTDSIITNAGKNAFMALRNKTQPLWMKFDSSRPVEWSDVRAARTFVA